MKRFRWLGLGDSADPTTWLGPNGHEHVHIKWQHLRETQLALVQKPAVQSWLVEQGIGKHVQAAAWPCGRLFLPWSQQAAINPATFAFPGCVSPEFGQGADAEYLSVGWWIYIDHLRQYQPERPSHRFLFLDKTSLFAPRCLPGDTTAPLLTWREACQQAKHLPIQGGEVAELRPNEQGWQEVRRLWVVTERTEHEQ